MKISIAIAFVSLSLLVSGCGGKYYGVERKTEEILHIFYDGKLEQFGQFIDPSFSKIIDSLFNSEGFKMTNKYEIVAKVDSVVDKNLFFVNSMISVKIPNDPKPIVNVLTLRLRKEGDKYMLLISDQNLLQLLLYEGEICNSIGKTLYNNQMFEIAKEYFTIGSKNGITESKYYLGSLNYYSGDSEKAIRLLEEAFEEGYLEAAIDLSHCYSFSGKKDSALRILKKAAKNGSDEAMVWLGEHYRSFTRELELQTSFYWYSEAAKKGNVSGMYNLGWVYEHGVGRSIDIDSAFFWYRKASNLKDPMSMIKVGRYYIEGKATTKDVRKGIDLIESTIKLSPMIGYEELGNLYLNGIGVDINVEKAIEYYQLAKQHGSFVAKETLNELVNFKEDI